MAITAAKVIDRIFKEELLRFETDNMTLRNNKIERMGGMESNRNEAKEWVDKPAIAVAQDGLDMTDKFQNFTHLSVPRVVNTYTNHPFALQNTDTLDEYELARELRAGFQAIGARVNRAMAITIYNQGAIAVAIDNGGAGGTPITFNDVNKIRTAMIGNDIDITTPKTLMMNVRDAGLAADDLATRQTLNKGSIAENAYEEAFIARISGLKIFETGFTPPVPANGATVTVAGADQNVVPVSATIDANGDPTNVDNRSQNLVVDSTTGVVAGDKFTLALVFQVSMINKKVSTSVLQTFTVKSVVDATNLEISPQIVVDPGTITDQATQAEANYANCSVAPANAAALTFLNLVETESNLFWENGAAVLKTAPVVGSEDKLGGIIISNESTGDDGLGLNFVLAKQGDINDFSAKWRLTTRFGANLDEPEKAGVLLTDQ